MACGVALASMAMVAHAQPGTVLSHQKISDTEGGFTGILDNDERFGTSAASLGDLDGDGVGDLAVGAHHDNDGGSFRGAIWILFLNTDGTVKSHQKISDTAGGFTGILGNGDQFGVSVVSLGDLDGDEVGDLAVGANLDDDGGENRGAVWILFLNTDGTVKAHQKISDTEGGFSGTGIGGKEVASLGDFDGDGVGDLAVSGWALWILFLNTDGTVKSHQEIIDPVAGGSLAFLGDLDGDGVGDLAAGTPGDDDGGENRGAVWILFLNTDGTVKFHQKISDTEGNFTGILDDFDRFGISADSLGDLDGDGVGDLAVGARYDGDGGYRRGAVWVLFLNINGTVKSHQKISNTQGGFTGVLDDRDYFGTSAASLGDLDGDGVGDLAVGANWDDDGGSARGAVWVLFLDGVPSCAADVDGDGDLDAEDFFAYLDLFANADDGADIDGDGDIDAEDFFAFLDLFVQGC